MGAAGFAAGAAKESSGSPRNGAGTSAQQAFDFAATRAQLGIERAAARADRNAGSGWRADALARLQRYVEHQDHEHHFTIEEARLEAGITVPPGVDGRVFGAITQTAVRLGLIERTGLFAPAASSNGSPKPLYRRVRKSA